MPYALRAPFLVPEAAHAAERALRLRQPVWLTGGPGAGAYQVARALHRDGDPLGFVSVRRALGNAAELEARLYSTLEADPAGEAVTLYVERIERQPAAIHECVIRHGDEGALFQGRMVPVRIIAQSDEGCRPTELMPALRHRLLPLVVILPPLSSRREEIAQIARVLADEVAAELGLGTPTIDEKALRGLAESDWPGNVDELRAVITRALLGAEGQRIERFELLRAGSSARPARVAPGKPQSAGAEPREIELIIAELAHELKNPMVTIKTFAENLDQLLADPALREKFTALACEAVDRMDGFLEELLHFSRFSEPRSRTLSLTQTLAQTVATMEEPFRRQVEMEGIRGKLWIRGDEDQLAFALKTILRGLCREIPPEATIHVDAVNASDAAAPHEIVFRSTPMSGTQQKLAGLLDHASNGNAPSSLDFIMAEALMRRNGGSSRIQREPDALNVRVQFATAEPGNHD